MRLDQRTGSRPQIQIVLCGPKSSGKTVYITTIFGRAPNIKTSDDQTTQLLQADWKRLESGTAWPSATALGVRELAFTYYDAGVRVDLNINDYDGQLTEVLSLSSDDEDVAENLKRFREMVRSASGLIFLFPFGEQVDDDRMRKFRDEINTFLSLVEQGGVNRDALSIPVVVTVNKWDRAPEFGAPNEVEAAIAYLEATPVYRDAFARIRTFLPNHSVIPVSTQRPSEEFNPLRPDVEPHNLLEPLRYILESVFGAFEREYAALTSETEPGDDRERFALLSSFYREIQNYKNYGEIYADLETSIAKGFKAEFDTLDARSIDQRMSDEAWFFEAIRSHELIADFENMRRQALAEKFRAGLKSASDNAENLKIFKKENLWLFDRLGGQPEYEQAYAAAVERAEASQKSRKLRRTVVASAAILVCLFGAWTSVENISENRQFDRVLAMRNDPSAFAGCDTAARYQNQYSDGFHAPLLFVGGHLTEARVVESEIQGAIASRMLERIDFIRAGQSEKINAVSQEFNAMVEAHDRCLPEGFMTHNRSPREELRAIGPELQAAVTFQERVNSVQQPPAGCADIIALGDEAKSVKRFSAETGAAQDHISKLADKCGSLNACEAHRAAARSASGYQEFRARIFDPAVLECERAFEDGMYTSTLSSLFAKDRDTVYARLDDDNKPKLVNSFTTGAQLDEVIALLADMETAEADISGVDGSFVRSEDIAARIQSSKQSSYDYLGTYSLNIREIVFAANSDYDDYGNPLRFECSSMYDDRSNIEIEFAGVLLTPRNCEGSGYSSKLRWGLRNFPVYTNDQLQFWPKRVKPCHGGRCFRMSSQTLRITRDNIYELKTNGQTTVSVPETSYKVTLYRE